MIYILFSAMIVFEVCKKVYEKNLLPFGHSAIF